MPYNAKTNWALNETVQPEDVNRWEQGIANAAEREELIATQKFQTAGGTATAIVLNGVTLTEGFSTTFITAAANNQTATTINSKPLYKANTTTTPKLLAQKAYTVWYSASKNCFYLQADLYTDEVEQLQNARIGGRNLARSTNMGAYGWWAVSSAATPTEAMEDFVRCCQFTKGAATGTFIVVYDQIEQKLYEPNKQYTISFKVKPSTATTISGQLTKPDGTGALTTASSSFSISAGVWNYVSLIVTTANPIPDTSPVLRLSIGSMAASSTITFKDLKIEQGNKGTDWTPAPEDFESQDTPITLMAANWTGSSAPYSYSLVNNYDNATYDVELMTSSANTIAHIKALEKAKISSNASANVVLAYGTKPTIDIPVVARIRLRNK